MGLRDLGAIPGSRAEQRSLWLLSLCPGTFAFYSFPVAPGSRLCLLFPVQEMARYVFLILCIY